MNFVTPNSHGFPEFDEANSASSHGWFLRQRGTRKRRRTLREDAAFTEIGWTDAARVASALARKAHALGRRAARLAVRRKVPKLDLWPSSRRTKPYRSFENGRMVRLHGAPVNFYRGG